MDILEQGGRYIESTEDFLRRTGHWLETEPPEEEIDAQLASDFADFAEPELRERLGRTSWSSTAPQSWLSGGLDPRLAE